MAARPVVSDQTQCTKIIVKYVLIARLALGCYFNNVILIRAGRGKREPMIAWERSTLPTALDL